MISPVYRRVSEEAIQFNNALSFFIQKDKPEVKEKGEKIDWKDPP